jgi:hypothetical protein
MLTPSPGRKWPRAGRFSTSSWGWKPYPNANPDGAAWLTVTRRSACGSADQKSRSCVALGGMGPVRRSACSASRHCTSPWTLKLFAPVRS